MHVSVDPIVFLVLLLAAVEAMAIIIRVAIFLAERSQ
jgi:hypothetical protein